jgi:hypothetical protein
MTAAFKLPIPRITVHVAAGEPWSVDFGTGATGRVWVDTEDHSAWPSSTHRWTVTGPGLEVAGACYSRDFAFRSMWCRAAQLSPPPPIECTDMLARASAIARADVRTAAEEIRKLLEQRTGRRWSVTVGRGQHRERLTICSLGRDLLAGGMVAADGALLAAVLQVEYVGPRGHTIGPRMSARAAAVLAIAGLPREGEPLDWGAVSRIARPPSAAVH